MANKNDFESIAQVLEKTLISENSEQAKRCDWRRPILLRECRTIGFTATRQTGKTEWIFSRAKKDPVHSLILFPTSEMKEELLSRFTRNAGVIPQDLRVIVGKPYEQGYTAAYRKHPITHVYVDEAYFYFSRVRRDKTYESLLTNFTLAEDVIFYLVN
ncbi:hypothetical protein [Klebsiella pneumoniae]|uniref:hypothetical protein n=1 Tax=Klebsiella pneumoniae TaxID=573 RepID=UPI000D1A0D2D|nr:hypothetical protein [Klebsiella pneumoniae]